MENLFGNQFFSGGFLLIILGSLLATFRKIPFIIWAFIVRQLTISLEIRNNDSNFFYFEKWADQNTKIKFKEVVVNQEFGLSPAPGIHFFFYHKRLVRLVRSRNENNNTNRYSIPEKFIIQFIPCRDFNVIKSFLKDIKKAYIPNEDNILTIKLGNQCLDTQKRKINTIFLPSIQKENILNNINWFLNNREWYEQRGIPWRYGYLLYGPPGNGKTTLVKCIASEFNLSLKVIQLSALEGDSSLLNKLITNKPEVILIEDIDGYDFAQARKIENNHSIDKEIKLLGGITLSGLLNAIDGVAPSDGRLLFLTTNYPENLDKALLRPGRIDEQILLDNASPEQAEEMFDKFFPNDNEENKENKKEFIKLADGNTSMANLQLTLLNTSNYCSQKTIADRQSIERRQNAIRTKQ